MRRWARSGRRGFGRKRSVNWTPGFSGLDQAGTADSLHSLYTNTVGNVYTVAYTLTADSDLQLHGGEDAVVVRMEYELYFFNSTKATVTAQDFAGRLVFVQEETTASNAIPPVDYTSSAGLGRDNILHTRDFLLSSVGAIGNEAHRGAQHANWLRGDIKVKRKLQSGNHIYMVVQTVKSGANVPEGFNVAGHVRTLLMRPR